MLHLPVGVALVAALDGRWFFSVDVGRRDAADAPADATRDATRDAALDARGRRADALADAILSGSLEDEPADSTAGCVPAPPPPSRTNWTRLIPPPVLTGHVSSLLPY